MLWSVIMKQRSIIEGGEDIFSWSSSWFWFSTRLCLQWSTPGSCGSGASGTSPWRPWRTDRTSPDRSEVKAVRLRSGWLTRLNHSQGFPVASRRACSWAWPSGWCWRASFRWRTFSVFTGGGEATATTPPPSPWSVPCPPCWAWSGRVSGILPTTHFINKQSNLLRGNWEMLKVLELLSQIKSAPSLPSLRRKSVLPEIWKAILSDSLFSLTLYVLLSIPSVLPGVYMDIFGVLFNHSNAGSALYKYPHLLYSAIW